MTKPSLFKPGTWDEDEGEDGNFSQQSYQLGLVPDVTNVAHRLAYWISQSVDGVKLVHIAAATGLKPELIERIVESENFKSILGEDGQVGAKPELLSPNKAKLVLGLTVETLLQRMLNEPDGMTVGELLKITETLGDRVGFTKQTTERHEFAFIDGDAIKKIKAAQTVNNQNEFDQAEDIASIAERQQKALTERRRREKLERASGDEVRKLVGETVKAENPTQIG